MKASPQKVFRTVTEYALECCVDKLYCTLRPQDRNEFLGRIEQNRKLLSTQSNPRL